MPLPRITLCAACLLGVFAAPGVQADPLRALTFIEVRSSAAERGRPVLQRYEQAVHGHSVLVLQETARPEKFALIETAPATDDRADQDAAQLSGHLAGLLTAPLDRRAHREFGEPAPAPAPGTAALYVITHLDIAPPERAKGERALQRLAEQARHSPGNLRFEVWQQTDRSNHFNLIAAWRSRADFNNFAADAAAREFRTVVASLLGSPYDERFYRRADQPSAAGVH
jgi:quinol monooxygenase YgiN